MDTEQFSVRDFYAEKGVLVTGGTGGVGKLVVQKLLRSCPNVGQIYLLIRPKRGKTSAERLRDVLDTPVFDYLKENLPSALSKIIVIEGNLCEDNLGLSEIDKSKLIENVSVVLHCAASLRFDMSLRQALEDNVFGTRNLLSVCEQMKKIEVFVYVSTLYSTCNKPMIEERIPSIPALDGKLNFAQSLDDFVKTIPADVADDWPNTYTFSKALAEIMINEYRDKFPVSIVRPSIIVSALKEPMPGWIDNYYGATVDILNGGLGILRSGIYDRNICIDLIPTDIVVNSIICVGSRTKYRTTNDVTVYNCCSVGRNPVVASEFLNECQKYNRIYPSMAAIRYPDLTLQSSYIIHWIICAIQHKLPAYALDFIAFCQAKPMRLKRIYKKLAHVLSLTEHFRLNEWQVEDRNLEKLNKELTEDEQMTFYTDPKIIEWNKYASTYVLGIREYLLKENPNNLTAAVARMNRLYWIEKALQCCFVIGALLMFYYCTLQNVIQISPIRSWA